MPDLPDTPYTPRHAKRRRDVSGIGDPINLAKCEPMFLGCPSCRPDTYAEFNARHRAMFSDADLLAAYNRSGC